MNNLIILKNRILNNIETYENLINKYKQLLIIIEDHIYQ